MNSNTEKYYDLFDDYELIESSFAQQYSIRLRLEEDMSWDEFCVLLSGLNEKTPLNRIVSIRSEKDPKIIKDFTPEQRRIRHDWIIKMSKEVGKDEYDNAMKHFEEMFKYMSK